MEKLLFVLSQCICVTPVLVLQAYELCLWLNVVTILRVGSCIRTPNLFGIVVLPTIAELRTECDILVWLLLSADGVGLLDSLLIRIGIGVTLCWVTAC